MTIISLKKQFKQFFNSDSLQKTAKNTELMKRCRAILPDKLAKFDDVLLQDGSSFHVHRDLAKEYPSRFKRNPAAVECHMTMSLKHFSPVEMTITADTASERDFLPKPETMRNKLLLADAGYPDFSFFTELERHGGFYIFRAAKSLNPTVIEARISQGRRLPKLEGKKLKDITRGTNRSEVLDLSVRRGKQEFRVIRRWFAEEKRYCIWVTNLHYDSYSADDIMAIYRCRWQVELLFKELKSHTNWQRFVTAQKAIVEGLIWASLLALIIRRSTALQIMPGVSLFKAAKNVDVWLLPIFECISHKAWSEIGEKLAWATSYILKNASKSTQRKSKKNITLDGIYAGLNA
jgi:hypothetical protein